ncbi:BMC domain-containing protein [Desulfosporosinus sp. PR]|uniref:BMC domain-containing protein n=1 Tax=Candidatus Desulfosporosinus nitrosoreducens TaxID=3401928 RepID=UPI0027F2CB25|nr:BMC domain-containing protein [Desulfosporosinus sp. PR]MDQ7095089.1 BMC domain-containing protein [Desulfosporosinus sp. PR]
MQALGLIETRGLLAAIECTDVMLKTAQVELVGRTLVGGGLVTVAVRGDVAAVASAVAAGVTAAEKINGLSVISRHIIPRPHEEIESILVLSANLVQEGLARPSLAEPAEVLPNPDSEAPRSEPFPDPGIAARAGAKEDAQEPAGVSPKPLHGLSKEEVDLLVRQFGLEKGLQALKALSLVKLRKLVREYKEPAGPGGALNKAGKDLLLQALRRYYEKETKP